MKDDTAQKTSVDVDALLQLYKSEALDTDLEDPLVAQIGDNSDAVGDKHVPVPPKRPRLSPPSQHDLPTISTSNEERAVAAEDHAYKTHGNMYGEVRDLLSPYLRSDHSNSNLRPRNHVVETVAK